MRTAVRILATRLWYRHVLLHVTPEPSVKALISLFADFSTVHSGAGLDRRLVLRWATGETYVGGGHIRRVESRLPGTEIVYSIATLLRPGALSRGRAIAAVAALTEPVASGCRGWALPALGAIASEAGDLSRFAWGDSAGLASRRDFLAFLAVLALLRQAASARSFDDVRRHATNLIEMLPEVASLGWVRPDVDLLLQCLGDLMSGPRWVSVPRSIDWGAFRRRIDPYRFGNPQSLPLINPKFLLEESGAFGSGRPLPLLPDVTPLWTYVRSGKARPVPRELRPLGRGGAT